MPFPSNYHLFTLRFGCFAPYWRTSALSLLRGDSYTAPTNKFAGVGQFTPGVGVVEPSDPAYARQPLAMSATQLLSYIPPRPGGIHPGGFDFAQFYLVKASTVDLLFPTATAPWPYDRLSVWDTALTGTGNRLWDN